MKRERDRAATLEKNIRVEDTASAASRIPASTAPGRGASVMTKVTDARCVWARGWAVVRTGAGVAALQRAAGW